MINEIFFISLVVLLNLTITKFLNNKPNLLNLENNRTKFSKEKLNNLIISLSIIATALGSGSTIGAITGIINGKIEYLFGFIISINWLLFIRAKIASNLDKYPQYSSAAEIFEYHYNNNHLTKIILFLEFLFCTGHLGAQLAGGYYLMNFFMTNGSIAVIVIFISVIYYTLKGGYRAVVFTDWVQYCIIIAAVLTLAYICSQLDIRDNSKLKIWYKINWSDVFKYTIIFTIMSFYPTFLTRLNSISTYEAKKALKLSYFSYLIYILVIGYISLKILGSISYQENIDRITFQYILEGINPGYLNFIILGFIFAIITTADSDLEHGSRALLKLLYFFKTSDLATTKITEYNNLIFKFAVACLGGMAIIIALKFENILEFLIFVAGFWSPLIFISLLGCFFDKTIKSWQLIANMLLTSASFIYFNLTSLSFYFLEPIILSTIFNLILYSIFYIYNLLEN